MNIQPVIETGTIRRKRSHVIQELIETERAYVSDLKNIIQGYYDQFDNEEMVHLIPEGMMAKRETFFGNIRDIYHFHAEIFLKGLEACDSRPSEVGRCFTDNKERLQLYSEYCQNKIQAEILIEKFGDSNPFFKACQAKLNHPLPLSSYILKPVQRITKYHLLLKELIRMTTQEEELCDLRKAIVAIGDVLRFVNNSMHQLSIIGYNGNLSDLGRLLIVGPLEVTVDKRKDRSPSLKQTYHKRQVFMYDRCLLFCKRKEPGSNNTLPSYIFKSALKTEEVGPLVESPRGGDERKFELWSKNEVWSFMAPSIAEKADWVDEIKKVLFEQMDMMRAASKRLHIDSSTDGGVVIIDPLVCLQSNELDSLLTVDTLNLS
ncbi:hypothetical protein HELRODRAFT_113767 [Helobdella robusta]|uniref:DH domain-containing protein n=1 Tax=Helobdella robusta TaxID=6412 RepID=T1EFW1_HELRO|nr:hypothetical protein HELRODRAFT_113767 [Helobdella robusta]ESN98452.1 hypothetical protein HELRODRAFT_113767 [Helobdella robusta]